MAVVIAASIAGALIAASRSSMAPSGPQQSSAPSSLPGPSSTDPQGFDLPSLRSAAHVRLTDFRGRPTVVDLFATWCSACRADLPELAEISGHLRGQVNFVAVETLESTNGLSYAEALGIASWPLAHDVGDRDGGLHDALGAAGMPVAAFYSADGRLLRVAAGQQTIRRIRGELHELYGLEIPDPTE